MDTIEDAFEFDSALVFGIGGSGDVVGSVPTARLLELHGVDVLLGGIAFEPVPYDPQVGPRSLDEIEDVERVSDALALTTGGGRTVDGVRFKESIVADHYDDEVALIDVTGGAEGLHRGIEAACDALGIGGVVGVDVGSDVLARGDEPGLRSPLVDGLGLVALDALDRDACLGVYGYGSDGELTLDEIEAGIRRAAETDGLLGAWGLTRRVRRELETLLEEVETEASRLPVQAARGEFGQREIRDGDVLLRLTPPSVVTFYFDPTLIAATSEIASLLRGTESIEAAVEALDGAGISTEFDLGRERLERE